MNKVQKIIAVAVVFMGIIPNTAAFAEENTIYKGNTVPNNIIQNDGQLETSDEKVQSTTSSAVVVNYEVTTSAAVVINDNVAVKLETHIEGTALLGQTVEAKVIGYNATGEKVELDESKLTYEWFANGKEVGESENLTITQDMDRKGINCTVNYDEKEVSK